MRPTAIATLSLSLSLLIAAPIAQAASPATLGTDDIAWLRRDSFGLDTATVAQYRALGRKALLEKQLDNRISDALPAPIAAQIAGYESFYTPLFQLLTSIQQEQQQIKAMPDGPDKVAANKAIQARGNQLGLEAQQAEMLHAIYGQNQLKEQLVWFWLNHFSVYAGKGRVRWELADYEQNVIRPHALGKFRDLVMATLESPAMLEFLDNAQNAKGHVNENYARELMELHTLGVNSGYTQQDVQQLALILTGVGIAPTNGKPEKFPPNVAPLVVKHDLFEFNPQRHDFRDKMLLGKTIKGRGFDEVKQAVDLIVQQPACAQFISRKLAEYFVSDNPPPALVAKMARTFHHSDGDIAQVMRVMFESKDLLADSGKKFKDPTQFVVSSVRLAYDGTPIANAQPLVGWLNQLDQPLFGRITPDGWPLDSASWSSSGQMAKRFDIAHAIGTGNNQLFTPIGSTARGAGFPMLTTRLYYDAIEPDLSAAARDALSKATSQQEWNTFLLSSPDLNYR
ncbi:hypothetical protein GCM10007863_17330 [Dyella mobilis]|uniref:DUF1800 domain-containing protein n=2 Tax=Dyella mobilis TaxID=1849582 RepID=A0ABS2KIH6_9GAMM|nr:DUF1800 domain-containing protein [Dyella mobilis]MBM7130690.1 DUF1800 domain-containing protein [Dyella mobilis]GLQ97313.1 hypothetical protein GCM10007863_17330 [Dyella mobilis]